MSNGEYFPTTKIALVILIAILPQSTISSSSINRLIEQIYGILHGSLLRNIQKIENISKIEAKEGLTECTGAFDECIGCDAGTPTSSSTSSTWALLD
jgi:hypothetical protein